MPGFLFNAGGAAADTPVLTATITLTPNVDLLYQGAAPVGGKQVGTLSGYDHASFAFSVSDPDDIIIADLAADGEIFLNSEGIYSVTTLGKGAHTGANGLFTASWYTYNYVSGPEFTFTKSVSPIGAAGSISSTVQGIIYISAAQATSEQALGWGLELLGSAGEVNVTDLIVTIQKIG